MCQNFNFRYSKNYDFVPLPLPFLGLIKHRYLTVTDRYGPLLTVTYRYSPFFWKFNIFFIAVLKVGGFGLNYEKN
jgi:hypothetical protein